MWVACGMWRIIVLCIICSGNKWYEVIILSVVSYHHWDHHHYSHIMPWSTITEYKVIWFWVMMSYIDHNVFSNIQIAFWSLLWRHNEPDGVSNHQPHHCLLNRLFGHRSKKTSKLRVTGLCVGNSPGTGEFPAQMASNAENVSIWWRHHVLHRARRYHCHVCTNFQNDLAFAKYVMDKLDVTIYEFTNMDK